MEQALFSAPIPGNSLMTHSPGERPWERPSELSTTDEALRFYFTNLNDDEVIDDLMTVIDMGVPINPIVETLYLSSVMNGIHNLDVGLIVAPVLSEFLAAVAKSYDIDYKFSSVDPQEQKEEREQAKLQMLLQSAIDKGIEAGGEEDKGVALLQEMSVTLDEQTEKEDKEDMQDQPPQAEEGMGLMARKGM